MKSKFLIYIPIVLLFLAACSKDQKPVTNNKQAEVKAAHEVTVEEVIQVSEYTYLRVKESGKDLWLAAPKADIQVGTVITFNKSMEMKDFESKELKRKFASIYFVDNLDAKLGVGTMNKPIKPSVEKENVQIEKAVDGITLSQLFANPANFENKIVKVKGKVVKLNTGIMNTNWVHIQDGTSSGNDFDLTITTNEFVNKGDIVSFTGKIILNKDFGYGYSYKVLMENAKVDGAKKAPKMMSM